MKSQKIHIIAEAGTNHNGSLNKAKELVDIAVKSNANSIKFQIIFPEELYLPGKYAYGHYDIEKVIKIRRETMLSEKEYDEIVAYCNEVELPFSASVFGIKSLSLLCKYKPSYIKVASCDLNNINLLRSIADKNITMVISTGMATLSEIEKTVVELSRINFTDIVLLHCVSVYPASLSQSNLGFIDLLKQNFSCPIGYSDHTGGSIASCIAYAKGATWFEKHFTADSRQEGFDHAYAMEENGLIGYVDDLHNAVQALACTDDKLGEAELYTKKRARRSIYANRDLKSGEVITIEDLLIVRPEGSIAADLVDSVVGSVLIKDISRFNPISFEFLEKKN